MEIFSKIGAKATAQQGIDQLHDFLVEHPEVPMDRILERTSVNFQRYISRALDKARYTITAPNPALFSPY
jgi:hypothetical protein